MRAFNLTITTTATLIADGSGQALPTLRSVSVLNNSATIVYVGGPDVTADSSATGGYPLSDAGLIAFDTELLPGEKLYGIVAAGTQAVKVIRNGE